MSDTYTAIDTNGDNLMIAKSLMVCGAATTAMVVIGWLIEAGLL